MRERNEGEICISFYNQVQQLIRVNYFPKKFVIFHIANEQKTNIAYTLHLKKMGLLKGIPDYCCIAETGVVCFLEFKRNPKCKLTPAQKAFKEQCIEFNIPYVTVYNETEAIDFLRKVLE